MSTSKYIRPMSFGELIRAALRIYTKNIWPLWLFFLLMNIGIPIAGELLNWDDISENHLLRNILLFLPAFLVGPATLTCSNIVLERPKGTWSSIRKGMSLRMIFNIFLFFSPVLILMGLLIPLGFDPKYDFLAFYMAFSFPVILLFPLWVFYPMALLLEKKNIFKSIGRVGTLILGQFRRLLLIQSFLIIVFVPVATLGMLFAQLLSRALGTQLDISLQDVMAAIAGVVLYSDWLGGYYHLQLLGIGMFFMMPFFYGFAITLYILHYYQVRAVKENFTEELLAQELGYQPIEEMMTV